MKFLNFLKTIWWNSFISQTIENVPWQYWPIWQKFTWNTTLFAFWSPKANSETKRQKIDPKVPNRPPRKGLQTGHWQNSGSYSKKRIFGPKSGPVAGKRPAERPLKIDPKVPNRPSRKGLQTGHWQNPGSYSKKRIFGPKMAKIRPFWAILVRNSETKTLKIDPKVPNRPSRKGLQTGHWQNPGSCSKKRIFGPKMAKIRPFWAILVRNSETKTLKIDQKVPNRPSRKGLQTGHWRNSGSYRKKRIFGPKMA